MARVVPPVGDSLLAGAFVVFVVVESVASGAVRSPVVHALIAVPAMAALAWRRRWPVGVAAVVIGSNLAINPEGEFSTLLAIVLVSFTVGAELAPPRSYVGIAVLGVPFLAGMVVEGLEPSDLAAAIVFLGGPFAVGVGLRQRSARLAEVIARADRMEREQQARAAAAVAEERARIARELHDIVSHSISVVAIQTQAVRRRLGPEQRREAADLAAVETTARQALAEMRRLFGVLRKDGDSPSLAPQPGLGELDRLVEQVRSAGLQVDVSVEGERVDLPPGMDLAAYRIVQEGLTNALRHAQASHARVRLVYDETTLTVTVTDDGRGDQNVAGGYGLVGVRERVALYGGSVVTGPGPGGGFRLEAKLPMRERL
jgi:signal transduction histidine kinase